MAKTAFSKKLDLNNLSIIYRNVTLAKSLELSFKDFIKIKKLTDINPFIKDDAANTTAVSIQYLKNTMKFIQSVEKIKRSGFTIDELEYLLRGYVLQDDLSSDTLVSPTEESISLILDEIRKGLQKIHAETTVVPDSSGELIKKKLALLKWNNILIQEVISTVTGSIDYQVPREDKPPALNSLDEQEKKIKEKISYDDVTKILHFIGTMTDGEKQVLLSKSNNPAYTSAVNMLYDKPRAFITNKMNAFEFPTFSTSLTTLPIKLENGQSVSISFPNDLKNKIYFDQGAKELRFVGAMTEAERKVPTRSLS